MAREAIRDKNHIIIGYIEGIPSGRRVRLMDRAFRTLGWYLEDRDVTTDANWRIIGRGDQLLRLIPNHQC
ncbi:hypothetical protein ILT44_29500 [Microvirga sp. BT689]|uniref:hypothetical protein n=1 Tax=Microvirga arvi TaxID=2778731 RepID=UPI001951418C|nr:hypothetical protein [Microvirga arvi]MBM6584334.1 hypothetical protein [Microvirga arvi]